MNDYIPGMNDYTLDLEGGIKVMVRAVSCRAADLAWDKKVNRNSNTLLRVGPAKDTTIRDLLTIRDEYDFR